MQVRGTLSGEARRDKEEGQPGGRGGEGWIQPKYRVYVSDNHLCEVPLPHYVH